MIICVQPAEYLWPNSFSLKFDWFPAKEKPIEFSRLVVSEEICEFLSNSELLVRLKVCLKF